MDGNRFWDNPFWDRVKKLSALASIVAAVVAIAWFAYTIWRDRSAGQSQTTPSQPGGSFVNLWTPTYVIGGCLILAAVIHLLAAFMSRRSLKKQIAQLEEERTSNSWLQTIAIREANAIHVVVRVLDCTLLYKDMDSEAPYVNFNFHLLNMSVYSVCIEKAIGGWVDFAGSRLGGHVKRTDQNDDFTHGQDSCVVVTQWLSKEDVTMIRSSNQQCSFTFKNLELWIRGSEKFDHDRQVIRGRLEIACHIERIGQGVLDNETSWLTDIVRDQAQTLYRFVHFTNLQYGKHELMRSDPYLEFSLHVDNRSLFDISFSDISGSISFAERELSISPTWQSRLPITQGNVGMVSLRQRLSKEDVVYILNGPPDNQEIGFDFGRLQIKVEGNHNLEPALLPVHRAPLTNKELLSAYPKLEIEIARVTYHWTEDLRIGLHANDDVCYVTLFLNLRNRRDTPISIQTFKLALLVNNKEYVSFAENSVFLRRLVMQDGTEIGEGEHSQNLSQKPPLELIDDRPIDGSLQFIFKELRYIESLTDGISLDNAPFTLFLIDKDRERHTQQGVLSADGVRYVNP